MKILKSKKYRYLNIKGAILDNENLKNYMEKVAINHEIKGNANKNKGIKSIN